MRIFGNLYLNQVDTVHVGEGKLTVEKNVEGSLRSSVGLQVNNGTFHVGESLRLERGRFNVNNASLVEVQKDCYIGEGTELNISQGYKMIPAVKIHGSLELDSLTTSNWSGGELIIGGNLLQNDSAGENSLNMTQGFRIVFDGKDIQKIQMKYPESIKKANLDFRKSVGVEVQEIVCANDMQGVSRLRSDKKSMSGGGILSSGTG